jgi:hypothetical protein
LEWNEPSSSTYSLRPLSCINSFWRWEVHHEVHGHTFPRPIWNKRSLQQSCLLPKNCSILLACQTSFDILCWHHPWSWANNNSFLRVFWCTLHHHFPQVIHCDTPSKAYFPSKHMTNFICTIIVFELEMWLDSSPQVLHQLLHHHYHHYEG